MFIVARRRLVLCARGRRIVKYGPKASLIRRGTDYSVAPPPSLVLGVEPVFASLRGGDIPRARPSRALVQSRRAPSNSSAVIVKSPSKSLLLSSTSMSIVAALSFIDLFYIE